MTPKVPSRRREIFDAIELSPSRLLAIGNSQTNDDRLAQLTTGIGMLAPVLSSPAALEERLIRVAAFCSGWLRATGGPDEFDRIHQERERQRQLYREQPGKYVVLMDSPVADNRRKLRVLVEELGEVAQQIDEIEIYESGSSLHLMHLPRQWELLHIELVHLSAVTVSWLETPKQPTSIRKAVVA